MILSCIFLEYLTVDELYHLKTNTCFQFIDLKRYFKNTRNQGSVYSYSRKGYLEGVKYLCNSVDKECAEECDEWAMDIACERGHLDVVR